MRRLTWCFSKLWLIWEFCRHNAELRIRVVSRLWQPASFSFVSPFNPDKWEVTLSHVDPATGETVRTFHTVDVRTKKGAEKARDALIFKLESDNGSIAVSHALGNGEGGFYLKEPKTGSSTRMIPSQKAPSQGCTHGTEGRSGKPASSAVDMQ